MTAKRLLAAARAFVTKPISVVGALLFESRRWRLAKRYLHGSGLEIGALHRPLRVSPDARVRYVDRMDAERLREHYPELAGENLVHVDVIEDGETLDSQPDGSADFIIANHFMEHTEDPLRTLSNHLRVLRPGGFLYLAVPDRRRTFDSERSATPLEHIVRDHREGPSWSRPIHQEEWARLVEKVPSADVPARVRALEEQDYSIHFHVWSRLEFMGFLEYARAGRPFSVEEVRSNRHEFIAILRRTP